ncbi:MAG: hypothetical protein ACD_28C00271G0001, partial [uncultured bacterium]
MVKFSKVAFPSFKLAVAIPLSVVGALTEVGYLSVKVLAALLVSMVLSSAESLRTDNLVTVKASPVPLAWYRATRTPVAPPATMSSPTGVLEAL